MDGDKEGTLYMSVWQCIYLLKHESMMNTSWHRCAFMVHIYQWRRITWRSYRSLSMWQIAKMGVRMTIFSMLLILFSWWMSHESQIKIWKKKNVTMMHVSRMYVSMMDVSMMHVSMMAIRDACILDACIHDACNHDAYIYDLWSWCMRAWCAYACRMYLWSLILDPGV